MGKNSEFVRWQICDIPRITTIDGTVIEIVVDIGQALQVTDFKKTNNLKSPS